MDCEDDDIDDEDVNIDGREQNIENDDTRRQRQLFAKTKIYNKYHIWEGLG